MNSSILRISISILAIIIAFSVIEWPKVSNYYDDKMHVYFLDVGQGDASMIKTPYQSLVLIDGGPGRQTIQRIEEYIPFWVNEIDLIVVSHSHADHITGLIDVLDKYEVGCIIYDDSDKSISIVEDEFRDLLAFRKVKNVKQDDQVAIQDCISDSSVDLENYSLALLSQDEKEILADDIMELRVLGAQDNENFETIVSKFSYNEIDVLFTGDAELPVQRSLVNKMPRNIDILKAPHQGSSDSYSEAILRGWSPEIAVISAGKGNKFGHPHRETIEGYKKLGIQILRTDENGSVHIVSDGKDWEFFE